MAATGAFKPMSRAEWCLLILLIASIFINYVDRGNLSIAAPLLQKQLALSPLQLGSLLSAFFWTYALLQLFGLAGWLADAFPVRLVFASGVFVWSVATVATGFLSGFAGIYAARLLLGAGESLAYPCYSHIFARDLPQHHRGRANALLDAGSKLGTGSRSISWRSLAGAGRMAPVLRRARHRESALADPVVEMDATLSASASPCGATAAVHAAVAPHSIRMGHIYRPLLRQLLLVFSLDLDTDVSR